MVSSNTIHPSPVSFQIASSLRNWTLGSYENASKNPSIATRTLAVISTTTAYIGTPVVVAACLVEALASGILGGIGAVAIAATGAQSILLQKFTIQSLSYGVSNLLGVGCLLGMLIPNVIPIHPKILPELLMGLSSCIVNETIGHYFDQLANRSIDQQQVSSNEQYKNLLGRIIDAIKNSSSPTDLKNSLTLALFKLHLKEKNIDIDSKTLLTAENLALIQRQFELAEIYCLSENEIPEHLKQNPIYFRNQLEQIVQRANPELTHLRLVNMIRNSEEVFSIFSTSERTRLFNDVPGNSAADEILQVMGDEPKSPNENNLDLAPITTITAHISSSATYQEQLRRIVQAAYTLAYRDMPHLFFVHIQNRERGDSSTEITIQEKIEGGRENLSSMIAFENLAKYSQYLEIACESQNIPSGIYPERQARINEAKRIFYQLQTKDKQLLITKLIVGDEIDPAIQALPEERRLKVQNLAQKISLLSNNFIVPLRNGDDKYHQYTLPFNKVRDFLASLRDSFNRAYSEAI